METKHEVENSVPDLSKFVFKRVLNSHFDTKSVFIEGSFSDKPGAAVVVLGKEPFPEKELTEIFKKDFDLETIFQNDIYSSFRYFPKSLFNGCKTSVIFPATEKHIAKYLYQPVHLIEETAELYLNATLPHLKADQFSLGWLHNVLDHKAEEDRIIFEDTNPETGFMLMPDLKWDGITIESLYLLAFPRKTGILSLRDLTSEHLPLLRNIHLKCLEVAKSKYNLERSRVKLYLHYQPTFYHLHVHVTHVQFHAPGTGAEHAHLLTTVINNIELLPDYYQRATIPFTLKQTDSLFAKYEGRGLVQKDGASSVGGASAAPQGV